MSTIAAGQVAGMTRSAALEFSFLVSIPTMIAATVYSFVKALHGETVAHGPRELTLLAIGLVVSFIVAYGVVAWFMSWVKERGFLPFAVYRVVVGIAVLAWALHAAS
jgi:undecaprenyl-diphosphatase